MNEIEKTELPVVLSEVEYIKYFFQIHTKICFQEINAISDEMEIEEKWILNFQLYLLTWLFGEFDLRRIFLS